MLDKTSSILLIDDSMIMRQMIKTILLGACYTNIDVAGNGKQGITMVQDKIAKSETYKVIFLDWNMPEMDGMEFLKICRSELNIDTAIIMLTAVSDQKSVLAALRGGASFYLTKPVSADMVIKKLDQIDSWYETQRKKA